MLQEMWTDDHRRMAARAGYSPEPEGKARDDVFDLVRLYRRLGSDRYAMEAVDREIAKRRPPAETQMEVLREVRHLLKEIRDLTRDR